MNRGDPASDAAASLRDCLTELAERGGTIIGEAVGGGPGPVADWRHYPAGEVYDPVSHLQFFFHRHPVPAADPVEYGHFHVFLRGEGMPAGAVPMLLPDMAVANAPSNINAARQSAPLRRGHSDEVCHLVAIAVDPRGAPVRLFTTNRWVTGEAWYRAEDVIGALDRVRFGIAAAPALLCRWVEAVVALFRPEIAVLLRQRDQAITEWRWRWPRRNALEDAALEITSTFAIDLEARLAAAEAGAARLMASPSPRPLPSMAEGWGA